MKTTTKVAIVIGALAAGRLAYDEYTIRKQKRQLEETADRLNESENKDNLIKELQARNQRLATATGWQACNEFHKKYNNKQPHSQQAAVK